MAKMVLPDSVPSGNVLLIGNGRRRLIHSPKGLRLRDKKNMKGNVYSCYICKTKKTKDQFHKDKSRNLGICSSCKDCTSKREQHKEYLRNYANSYPSTPERVQKLEARKIMALAIKSGRLKRKPCLVCKKVKSEGHHFDYTKPLDVQWLCDLHHQHLHRGFIKV